MKTIKSAAILVAAGSGERLAKSTAGKPKQFSQLSGIPLFVWSLTTFVRHPQIEQIIITVPEGWQDQTLAAIAEHIPDGSNKIAVIPGGNTRQESVFLALEKLAKDDPSPLYIMIHDAARPFVTTGSIDQILVKLSKGCAITLGIPLSDSIKRVEADRVKEDLDRQSFMLIQTPQAAGFEIMLKAHRQARDMNIAATDDATIIKSFGADVFVLPGTRANLKITEPEDLVLAQSLISNHCWCPGKI